MNAHIVQQTILQINQQKLCAVKQRQKEETKSQFFRDAGVNNSNKDDSEEHDR